MLRIWCLRPTKPAPPAHHHAARPIEVDVDTSLQERLLFQESLTSLFLPVICFWRNLSKFLMPHSNCPFSSNSLSVFVGIVPVSGKRGRTGFSRHPVLRNLVPRCALHSVHPVVASAARRGIGRALAEDPVARAGGAASSSVGAELPELHHWRKRTRRFREKERDSASRRRERVALVPSGAARGSHGCRRGVHGRHSAQPLRRARSSR